MMYKKSFYFSEINLHIAIVLICTFLLGFGYWLEYVEGLEPCPLCITQRICFFLILVAAGLGCLKYHYLRLAMDVIIIASTALGMIVAGRHLWIQQLPEELVPVCGPDLGYMLEVFPFSEVVAALLRGDGHCAEVSWTLFGISIPGWSFASFAFLGLITIWSLSGRRIVKNSSIDVP